MNQTKNSKNNRSSSKNGHGKPKNGSSHNILSPDPKAVLSKPKGEK